MLIAAALSLIVSTATGQPMPDLASAAGLLRHGVTFGAAAVVVSNAGVSDRLRPHIRQQDLGVTAMPYVALLPSYWSKRRVTALYCAAKALSLNEHEAAASARAYAKQIGNAPWQGQRSSCWTTGFGFYAGFPLRYSANFEFAGSSPGVRATRALPRGSFGAVWSPVRYFSLVIGLSRIAVPAPKGMTGNVLRHGWAYTIGAGAALDFAAKVLRRH